MRRTIRLKTDRLELVTIPKKSFYHGNMNFKGVVIPLNILVENIEHINYVFDKDFYGVKANKALVWTYNMPCYQSTGFVSSLEIILSYQL